MLGVGEIKTEKLALLHLLPYIKGVCCALAKATHPVESVVI